MTRAVQLNSGLITAYQIYYLICAVFLPDLIVMSLLTGRYWKDGMLVMR